MFARTQTVKQYCSNRNHLIKLASTISVYPATSVSDKSGLESVPPVIQVPVVREAKEHSHATISETFSLSDINPVSPQGNIVDMPVLAVESSGLEPSDHQGQDDLKYEVVDGSEAAKPLNTSDIGQNPESNLYVIASVKPSPVNPPVLTAVSDQTMVEPSGGNLDTSSMGSVSASEQDNMNMDGDQIQTINENGEKVLVKHYLLTSITTNTSTGKQTNQLITTPIVLPNEVDGSTTVPLQLFINPGSKENEFQVPTGQALAEEQGVFNESVIQSEQVVNQDVTSAGLVLESIERTASQVGQDGSLNLDFPKSDSNFENDPSKDKINITFIQRNETDDDDESIQVSTGQSIEFVSEMGSIMDTGAQMIGCNSESAIDPHCADNCSDYSEIVDGNKEYFLCNPVVDELQFQEDMESASQVQMSQDGDADVLFIAASKELSDTLSSI